MPDVLPPHIGRNHHNAIEVGMSVIGGFTASFLAFVFAASVRAPSGSLTGQLLAGDPTVNRTMPTTLNAMQAAMNGSSPVTAAMSSYGWWVGVLVGGLIASVIVLKLMRRYV